METKKIITLGLLFLLMIILYFKWNSTDNHLLGSDPIYHFDSSFFPDDFIWGTATSAYQTEGAADKYGRKPSIWDTFTHEFPERISDGSNGDVAVDFYHHYQEDIRKMSRRLGMNAFRFSISWSRIIPTGRRSEGVNEEGIDFYNRVINETIQNGMKPFVTMFHWDVPQSLEDEYDGFLSPKIVSDFKDFAELCFERFGDRVKDWITLNEPFIFSTHGYDSGDLAPGRCSAWVNHACVEGNSATEPYLVGHHLLLAHAKAVESYRKLGQDGKIGITLDVTWPESYSNSAVDREAAQRNLDFSLGWFMEPLYYGEYPKIMKKLVNIPERPPRLPDFTKEESQLVKGSYDFIGLNYYTANYASANVTVDPDPRHIRFATDSLVNLTKYKNGKPIGVQASPDWLYEYPQGLQYVLNYTKNAYNDPIIYITENGVGDNKDYSPEEALMDRWRIRYINHHLGNVHRAICDNKVNVKGYFAWSFIDNFEWSNGYTIRMGLYAVRDKHSLGRRQKLSVAWFQRFLKNKASGGGPKCGLLELKSESFSADEL
ncbi:beta-glucosidase 24-like [Mercurialis annua]|uniref:beta-glucosidase 24-like n=1 Tax=Mercurialis annua TaxID=3986 RepID=UPI00215F5C4B|nr:beta-glucosidase 24-like [Mercurialis annua]